jgi:diguanylate cyclase (GGDEF)-like protein
LLLALALAYQMRQVQRKRIIAEQLARLDPLTGLFNRRAFLDRAGPVWSTSQRNLRPLSVVMCDLDHFKSINDKHGHEMGDSALVAVSRVLAEACRSGDVVARWGGEEFILFLPETDAVQAMQLAERLRGEIGQLELAGENRGLAISASFGVATRDQQKSLDALIGEADKWLYEAKRAGRDRVRGMPAIATI